VAKKTRSREQYLRRKRHRRAKLRNLRRRYAQATKPEEREHILKKVAAIAPWLSTKEFLAPLKRTTAVPNN